VKLRSLLLLLFIASSQLLWSQRLPKRQPHFDDRPFHFGFSLGFNYYDFKIDEIADLAGLEGFYNVQSEVAPGYTIRIISSLRLSDYFDLRFTPGFAATERTLFFDVIEPISEDRQIVERNIESSFIELPFTLKWKSERVRDYRLYLQGGIKHNIDLASDEDVIDDRVFKVKQNDFGYEFGFGVDLYFEYFKFSPEIIATFGVSDLMVPDGTFYVEGIERLQTRALLINFTFE